MRRVIVDIDDYGDEVAYCLEQDGIPYDYNEIANSKVKKARKEIDNLDRHFDNDYFSSDGDAMFKCNEVLAILDKLIESEG